MLAAKKITAYMNNGRWLMNCLKCGTPLPAWESGVVCPRCYPGMLARAFQPLPGGLLRPVADIEIVEQTRKKANGNGEEYAPSFPAEKTEIEKILRLRPAAKNMNWLPSESLADLRKQNLDHGDPVPAIAPDGQPPKG